MRNNMHYWDTIDNIKLSNSIILVSQGKLNPYNVLYDYLRNNLVKSYIKYLFNLR